VSLPPACPAAPATARLQAYMDACLDTVGRVTASDHRAFYLVGGNGEIAGFPRPAALPEVQAAYSAHYWRHDPLYPARGLRCGAPVQSLRSQAGGSTIYRNFLSDHGIGDIAEIYLRLDDGRAVAGISLIRRSHGPAFSSGEIDVLKGLMPLLEFSAASSGAFAPAAAETAALTPRENELIRHLRRGLSNAEIADALGISLATVKTHVKHVLDKVGARSRTELLAKLFIHPGA